MNRSAFIFGRTPKLSFLELQTFFPAALYHKAGIGMVDGTPDAQQWIQRLGGTVKVAEFIAQEGEVTPEIIVSSLTQGSPGKKITFGLSIYGTNLAYTPLVSSVKRMLKQQGVSARYIEAKHESALSSVVVSKQHVTDIVIIKEEKVFSVGITRAVQDFEDWNTRDFDRPDVDPKSGMLPPKVARMIVNIALSGQAHGHHPMLMDPFCGVGTIVAEAALCGANTIGCDISVDAVARTKKNIEWLRSRYPQTQTLYFNIFASDATHVSAHTSTTSIDAIATEPYLGEAVDTRQQSRLTPDRVKNILKGLEKLYIGCFREWYKILKPGARIVIAMPAYVTQRGVMRVKNVVDRCESLGYTLLIEPIEYSRPQAVVRREFYVFQKK